MGDDYENDYDFSKTVQPCVRDLYAFLEKYKTPKKSKYTNILDQKTGSTYHVPYDLQSRKNGKDYMPLSGFDTQIDVQDTNIPYIKFFSMLEECRLNGIQMHFCERQKFTIPYREEIEYRDEESLSTDESKDIDIEKSCIEFDFDIYKKEKKSITSSIIYGIITHTIIVLASILDWEEELVFNIADLRKASRIISDPQNIACKKYGSPLWKESFHVRFFVKVSTAVKLHLRKKLLEKSEFVDLFSKIGMINKLEESFDVGSFRNPLMFLGSMKKGGNIPHALHSLYQVTYRSTQGGVPLIQITDDFKPVERIVQTTKNKKSVVISEKYCKFNLSFEMSINFEVPGGMIKKYEYDPKESIANEIKSNAERTMDGEHYDDNMELDQNNVSNLVSQDFDARFIKSLLDIIGHHRTDDYEKWRNVIIALARANKEYKPLAIWFSRRHAASYIKGGLQQLNGIWDWAVSLPKNDKTACSIFAIYSWAKEDNLVAYRKLQENNIRNKLREKLIDQGGLLNDVDFAVLLREMWGESFRCDQSRVALGKGTANLVWREFVYADTDQSPGQKYKWRKETYLYTLHDFISKKLPIYIEDILTYLEQKTEEVDIDEVPVPGVDNMSVPNDLVTANRDRELKNLDKLKKNIRKTKLSLGKIGTIRTILSACEAEFIKGNRGFEDLMDTDPDHIGVLNGVLQLRPTLKLITGYHEIPISKSTTVNYIPYDPENPHVKELEIVLREICGGNNKPGDPKDYDEENYQFWMMFFASGLDDLPKVPQYLMLGHGSGSQGKSVLSELDLNTKGLGRPGGEGGYANKIDVGWLCQDRKGTGPDSALSSTKKMRTLHGSETDTEAALRTGKVKEILSDHVAGNDKNEKQDVWKVNAHIIIMTNNKLRILGRDYGIWRRILYYRFKRYYKQLTGPDHDRYNPNDPTHAIARPEIIDSWINDINYKTAYFSILTHYYEKLYNVYDGNIRKVPKTIIDLETEAYLAEQDTISQFINSRVILIGANYPDKTLVEQVHITEIMSKYIKWHNAVIGGGAKFNHQELQNDIYTHYKLEKYFVNGIGGDYLKYHKVLDLGDSFTKISKAMEDPNTVEFDELKKDEDIPITKTIEDNVDDFDLIDDLDD